MDNCLRYFNLWKVKVKGYETCHDHLTGQIQNECGNTQRGSGATV